MVSRCISWLLLGLTTVSWNLFQRWLSKVAPVGWRINFISRNYGWCAKARFVIFGCSLPHLTMPKNPIISFLWLGLTWHPCCHAFQMSFHIIDDIIWSNIFHNYHWRGPSGLVYPYYGKLWIPPSTNIQIYLSYKIQKQSVE